MTGMTNVTKLASEPSGQEFLVFTLGDEEYGIDILKVQEIRGYDQVTRIANTPSKASRICAALLCRLLTYELSSARWMWTITTTR